MKQNNKIIKVYHKINTRSLAQFIEATEISDKEKGKLVIGVHVVKSVDELNWYFLDSPAGIALPENQDRIDKREREKER